MEGKPKPFGAPTGAPTEGPTEASVEAPTTHRPVAREAETGDRPAAVRVAAKAVIIHEGHLLVIQSQDRLGNPDQRYYSLPGGGQRPGETLVETMRRECLEEIGLEVAVGPLLYVREYIGRNHEYAHIDAGFHQVEMIFSCTLVNPPPIHPRKTTFPDLEDAAAPDERQTAIVWLELDRLEEFRFRPRALRDLLGKPHPSGPVYLGDVN